MPDFQPGEIVDITIKGVRVDSTNPNGSIVICADDDIWALPPQAAVTRTAPAEWPPQVDDLWRDKLDIIWFTVIDRYGNAMFTNSNSTLRTPVSVNQDLGPMSLVHREDQAEVTEP